jgi:hypothetical protein
VELAGLEPDLRLLRKLALEFAHRFAREQAEASDKLAAEWVAESLADFDVERMGVMGCRVGVSRVNANLLQPAGR